MRACARALGMPSSGVYRYVASRDELLTLLIVDAYDRLAAAIEEASVEGRTGDGGSPDPAARDRFVAGLHAMRRWATDHPHEHALLYGTPVPGYAAPATTIEPASRLYAALLRPLHGVDVRSDRSVPASLDGELAGLAAVLDLDLAPATALVATEVWAALVGAVSLELFGHLTSTITDRDAWFAALAEQLADRFRFPGVDGHGS